MIRKFIYTLLAVSVLFIPSCLHDELDDCTVIMKILFSYLGDGTKQIFLDKHDEVTLYVYNTNHEVVQQKMLSLADLTKYQGVNLDLLPGEYTIVCWGNAMDKTETHSELLTEALIKHKDHPEDLSYSQDIDSLYYGIYQLHVPKINEFIKDTTIVHVIPFRSAHVDFEVGLTEAKKTRSVNDLSKLFYITLDKLPATNTYLNFSQNGVTNYSLQLNKQESDIFYTTFSSLRFQNDNPIILNLVSKQDASVKHTINLKEFLEKESIDVQNYHEIKVPILIELEGLDPKTGMFTSLRVLKWIGRGVIVEVD